MACSRSYTFRIAIIAIFIFVCGFIIGLGLFRVKIVRRWLSPHKQQNDKALEKSISLRRMQAIREALKQGKDEYEFSIDSPAHLSR